MKTINRNDTPLNIQDKTPQLFVEASKVRANFDRHVEIPVRSQARWTFSGGACLNDVLVRDTIGLRELGLVVDELKLAIVLLKDLKVRGEHPPSLYLEQVLLELISVVGVAFACHLLNDLEGERAALNVPSHDAAIVLHLQMAAHKRLALRYNVRTRNRLKESTYQRGACVGRSIPSGEPGCCR